MTEDTRQFAHRAVVSSLVTVTDLERDKVMSKTKKKLITIAFTPAEAHTVLRALGVANLYEHAKRGDKTANTWVALRIASALGLTVQEYVDLRAQLS